MARRSAAAAAVAGGVAALSLSELLLLWAVLWKILSGGDVQGHSPSNYSLAVLFLSLLFLSASVSLSFFPLLFLQFLDLGLHGLLARQKSVKVPKIKKTAFTEGHQFLSCLFCPPHWWFKTTEDYFCGDQ